MIICGGGDVGVDHLSREAKLQKPLDDAFFLLTCEIPSYQVVPKAVADERRDLVGQSDRSGCYGTHFRYDIGCMD